MAIPSEEFLGTDIRYSEVIVFERKEVEVCYFSAR